MGGGERGEGTGGERERERERERGERERERERERLENFIYKDCSLGSVKNLTASPC